MQAQPSRNLAFAGALAVLPALLMVLLASSAFVAPSNLFYRAYEQFAANREAFRVFNLLSPIVFLGGSALAVALNIVPILRFNIRREGGEFVAAVRFKASLLNVLVAGLGLSVLAFLLAYILGENWQCIIGQKLTC